MLTENRPVILVISVIPMIRKRHASLGLHHGNLYNQINHSHFFYRYAPF